MRPVFLYFFLCVCLWGVYKMLFISWWAGAAIIGLFSGEWREVFQDGGALLLVLTFLASLLPFVITGVLSYLAYKIVRKLIKRYREKQLPMDEGDRFY